MIIPNLRVSSQTMTSRNLNFVVDQTFRSHKSPHFDSQSHKTLTRGDKNSDRFTHQNPPDSLVISPLIADDTVAVASRWGLMRNNLKPKRTTQEKVQVLVKTLKPIPFIPSTALDFKSGESLLRRLGLWDFVHIEFDTSIRSDLLAQLIASYTPNLRGGYVNGIKIMVNRADLGRALKLPAENTTVSTESVMDALELAESIAFIEKLVSMWMLLHEDPYIMPPEVLACTKLIKEGQLEMIDWAELIWNMVERELKASQLENCYYASHLQHLIKTQHEELLRRECKVDIEVRDKKEEEEEEEVLGEHNMEWSLGQDDVENFEVEKEQVGGEYAMDVEEFKEEPGQWTFLQQCNVGDLKSWEEEEEAEDEDECIPLVGMSPGSLLQPMEAEQMPFHLGNGLPAHCAEDFFSYGEDAQMVSEVSHFGNGQKRSVDEDNNFYQSSTARNKRLRSDMQWDAKPVDFNTCMGHIQHLMGEARTMYVTKAQACEEFSMSQQLLLNELQNRDNMIEHLRKANLEESQKRQMEVYRLERELHMMGKLLEGYRNTLKETQKAFTEYRVRCPQVNEPLYKDVPGSGGLVLRVMELEQERLKQEEQQRMKRLEIEEKLRDFEEGWIGRLEDHQNRINSLGERLMFIEDQAKFLIEVNAKCKVLHSSERAPSEGQTV